jgi:outer membrane receptor protein involved in Fe transport
MRTLSSVLRVLTLVVVLAISARAADESKKAYDLPAGDAVSALKQFSALSGRETLFAADAVRGVKTAALKGEFTPKEALERLLAETGLVATQDAKTGAFAVTKPGAPEKNDPSRRAESSAAAAIKALPLEPAVKMEEIQVLGSRIRTTEIAGPSPVSTYDRDFIEATGAMTLSDFLNKIPQTYSGIASGRSSAPDEFNPDFGQKTETTTPAINIALGVSDTAPAQTGVSGVSLRGLGAGSTLVLVDGRRAATSGNGNKGSDTRQGFVDLNTIPLGMIDHVEVTTDGASAIYGADAVAGVINIILKKNYQGTEITSNYSATEHGGGRERNLTVNHGFVTGKLSGSVALTVYDRQNVAASDRAFSRHQDHSGTTVGTLVSTGATFQGRNFSLNYGYPAVVQAAGGTVAGNFDAIPGVRVVAVPLGTTATPTPSQFTPITTPAPGQTVVNSSAQRRGNTSAFLDLAPEAQRRGANVDLKYKFNDKIEAFGSYRTNESRSYIRSQPTTSLTGSFGAAVTVPAAFNPFNQNVTVGMILADWGSSSQRVRTVADAAVGGLRGRLNSWAWELGYSWQKQNVRQTTRGFNGTPFANLLINPDPNLRFNPFVDFYAAGTKSQTALLEPLSLYPEVYSISKNKSLDFNADGPLFSYRGGTVKVAFGGSTANSDIWSRTTNFSAVLVPVATVATVTGGQKSTAEFAELYVPVFGKPNAAPLLERLDFQLAGRHEENGPFTKSVPKYGVSWSPVKSLLVRGSWSQGFRAPGPTEYLVVTPNQTLTLTDPRRNPPSTPGVVISRGSNPNPKPESSDNSFLGLVYEPTFAKGLNFQLNYYDTKQRDVLQIITAQNILNNESLFPDRVTRAAPTAADIALNQPGQVTGISQIFVNFGRVVNRSMDLALDYTVPWENYGRFRVQVAASRNLESTRQIAPGQPAVVLDDDTGSPPKWKFNASLFWRKGSWNASAFLWHLDGFKTNNAGSNSVANTAAAIYFPTPAVAKLDLRLGYTFKQGIVRGYGKNVRLSLGVNNVMDKQPPFSDTLWGYNAGLHSQLMMGRTYEVSLAIPF